MPIANDLYYFDSDPKGGTNKPILVLIHGAGGNYLHWPKDIRRLPGIRTLAPDLPAHGKSNGLGEQTIEGYANIVTRWLDQVGVGRANFVGHSMGGAIVQTIALNNPGYVLALGLIATGAKLPVNPDLLERTASSKSFSKALDLILKRSYSKNAPPRLITQVRKKMNEIRPAVLHGDFLACQDFDLSDRLSALNIPVQIIVGEQDKMTPPKMSEELNALIPKSKLEIIPEAGHMVMLEKAGEMVRYIGPIIYES